MIAVVAVELCIYVKGGNIVDTKWHTHHLIP